MTFRGSRTGGTRDSTRLSKLGIAEMLQGFSKIIGLETGWWQVQGFVLLQGPVNNSKRLFCKAVVDLDMISFDRCSVLRWQWDLRCVDQRCLLRLVGACGATIFISPVQPTAGFVCVGSLSLWRPLSDRDLLF